MKLIFDHTFGRQENQDLVICNPFAKVRKDEESKAIQTGWLALDYPVQGNELFYQSRSTRVDLEQYKPLFDLHEFSGKCIMVEEINGNNTSNLSSLETIYRHYMQRKAFIMDHNPFNNIHKRDSFLIFYTDTINNMIAFTKLKKYYHQSSCTTQSDKHGNQPLSGWAGYESVLHCNLAPISQLTLDMEMMWAKKQGIRYYYIGSGYETSSLYKSKWQGFQWWTGTEWSESKKRYRKLCRRDSRMESLTEVALLPSLLRTS